MRTLTHVVAGDTCLIFVPERQEDLANFLPWMESRIHAVLAIDTETTSTDVFGAGFGLRLLQIGDEREAWVIRSDLAQACADAVRRHDHWVAHNFAFDSQVLEQTLGITIETMTPKMFDTIIMSKLINPTRPGGHALKPLTEEFVDENALDTAEGLYAEFRRLGFTKDTGWAGIPFSNELYVRYAGLDVLYCARLFKVLALKIKADERLMELSTFEHTIQGYLNIMRRKGLRVDLEYAKAQQAKFYEDYETHLAIVRDEFGLANLNSSQQVQDALLASGAELTERTPGGGYKTGKDILWPLGGLDEFGQEIEGYENPNMLAYHIARGKRAERFASAYLGKFIDLADPRGYIHPETTGLQARTSRMAVSNPPLQQLPSKDWKVRRAIIADPGNSIISADYEQIELRIIAALGNVTKMKEAIAQGLDLHGYTAELAYGPDYTKQQRTFMKGAGFGIAYGGGAKGLARKMGIAVPVATGVVKAYSRVYPEIKRWSLKLQRDARRNGMVMRSATGRILALDRDRIYAAINYQVQSLAADVLKNALEAMWNAGLGEYLMMPVHDEVVAQAPTEDAEDVAHKIKELMASMIDDVRLDSDAEVYGASWGHGYVADSDPVKEAENREALAAYDYTLEMN